MRYEKGNKLTHLYGVVCGMEYFGSVHIGVAFLNAAKQCVVDERMGEVCGGGGQVRNMVVVVVVGVGAGRRRCDPPS